MFLGAWGAAKIPQLILEARFMGMPFTVARFVLTVIGVGLMGLLVNSLVRSEDIPIWIVLGWSPWAGLRAC